MKRGLNTSSDLPVHMENMRISTAATDKYSPFNYFDAIFTDSRHTLRINQHHFLEEIIFWIHLCLPWIKFYISALTSIWILCRWFYVHEELRIFSMVRWWKAKGYLGGIRSWIPIDILKPWSKILQQDESINPIPERKESKSDRNNPVRMQKYKLY